jgi:hypothetical protein
MALNFNNGRLLTEGQIHLLQVKEILIWPEIRITYNFGIMKRFNITLNETGKPIE